jgi:ABC-2 type transport system permease protein
VAIPADARLMRGLRHGRGLGAGHFLAATGLNPLWLAIGCAAFTCGFHRDRGSLLQQGNRAGPLLL